jgi:hypothetical protein
MLNGVHHIDDSAHENAVRILPHLDAIECVVNPVQGKLAEIVLVTITTNIVDHLGGKKRAPNVRVVKIFIHAITGPMVTSLTWMMAIGTTAKLVPLLTVIDDKQQGTNDVDNNPLATNFKRDLLQTGIISSLCNCHTFKNRIHDAVEVSCRASSGH